MTPKERTKRSAQLAAIGAVVGWALICYVSLLSPRLARLERLRTETTESARQLADMRREIEDARIAGPPATGASRFEKFGILGSGEEQLFLRDLISLCRETDNTLNLVRRSEVARPAASGAEPEQGRPASAPAAAETPQPVIERVPHTVSFSGTFLSSFHLLRRLEEYKRLLTVERMDVSVNHHAGHPWVSGDITIDLYLVKAPAAPGPPAADRPPAQTRQEQSAPGVPVAQAPAGGEENRP